MTRYKIFIITTSRADYSPLYSLIYEMNEDAFFDVKLLVTGSHLSKKHGYTIKDIKKENNLKYIKVKLNEKSDTNIDISKIIGRGIKKFSKIYKKDMPDVLMLLGDRYELLSACIPALINRIPITHIHGGELTLGAIDNTIRHMISKISSLHFTSTKDYRIRVNLVEGEYSQDIIKELVFLNNLVVGKI